MGWLQFALVGRIKSIGKFMLPLLLYVIFIYVGKLFKFLTKAGRFSSLFLLPVGAQVHFCTLRLDQTSLAFPHTQTQAYLISTAAASDGWLDPAPQVSLSWLCQHITAQ